MRALLMCTLLLVATPVLGAQIGWDDFSGGENWIDFDPGFDRTAEPILYEGVWFSDEGAFGLGLEADDDWSGYFGNQPGASLGLALNDIETQSLLRAEFTTTVHRVGLLMSAEYVATWTLEAYDSSDTLMDAVTETMSGNRQSVFLGLETSGAEIAYILVREAAVDQMVGLFDDLRFEAIPEPASLLLLAAGGLAVLRRR